MTQPNFCNKFAIAPPFSVFDTSFQVQDFLYLHDNIVKMSINNLHDPRDTASGIYRIHFRLVFDPGTHLNFQSIVDYCYHSHILQHYLEMHIRCLTNCYNDFYSLFMEALVIWFGFSKYSLHLIETSFWS